MMRLLLLVAVLVLATGTFLSAVVAVPAAAHEVSPPGSGIASDARSEVVAGDLPPGVTVEVLQNGLALRLRNATAAVVAVPAAGLEVPPGGSVQWHLDAAHPSAGPPGRPWRVVVEVDGIRHEVLGAVRWTPGPAPWPWLAGAAVVAAVAGGAAWRWRRPGWPAVLLGTAVLASAGHTVAALAARTAEGPRWGLLGDYLPQAGCWVLGGLAVVLLARRRAEGTGLGALAAAGLVLVTLVRDGAVLGASTVLVALPADLDRALVTSILGLAAGALIGLLSTSRRSRSHPVAR
jgi:hypothetical protein